MFELKSHEDHTSYPEEDDIVTSYENTCWVPLFKLRSLFRPPHCSKWPQARAEPCIKNIWILCYMTVAMRTFSDVFTAYDSFAAVITVPCRNTMAPPQLTGNGPVTDVFKPVYISFCKTFRNKLYFVVFNNLKSWLCQWFHIYEPLFRYHWLDNCITTRAMTYCMVMIIDFFK